MIKFFIYLKRRGKQTNTHLSTSDEPTSCQQTSLFNPNKEANCFLKRLRVLCLCNNSVPISPILVENCRRALNHSRSDGREKQPTARRGPKPSASPRASQLPQPWAIPPNHPTPRDPTLTYIHSRCGVGCRGAPTSVAERQHPTAPQHRCHPNAPCSIST